MENSTDINMPEGLSLRLDRLGNSYGLTPVRVANTSYQIIYEMGTYP